MWLYDWCMTVTYNIMLTLTLDSKIENKNNISLTSIILTTGVCFILDMCWGLFHTWFIINYTLHFSHILLVSILYSSRDFFMFFSFSIISSYQMQFILKMKVYKINLEMYKLVECPWLQLIYCTVYLPCGHNFR